MSLNIGPKLPAVEETTRSGLEPPPNSPVSVRERFAAAVAELPESSRLDLMAYGEGELEFRVDDAIRDGNMEALKLLLDSGVKPTAMMLRFAIYKDKREAVVLLLERGVDPNALWEHKHNLEKIIPYMKLLLSHGADKAQFTAQFGPEINRLLLDACAAADVDRVKTLIICGADVNQMNDDGFPLVHVTWLTEHRVSGEERSELIKEQTAIIRLLCANGADPAQAIQGQHTLSRIFNAPREITVCLLGQGLINDYSPLRSAPVSERLANLVLGQLDIAIHLQKGKLFNDCVRALAPILTCQLEDVRDKCAAALAKAMHEYDWAVPEETHAMVHEALREYLEKLDGDPPHEVKRYAAKYNFPERLEEEEARLLAAGLTVSSPNSKQFVIKGDFEVRMHGLLLVEYARLWLTNPETPQDHAEAILAFVQASMNDLNDNYPEDFELRIAINNAIEVARDEAAAIHRLPARRLVGLLSL